MFFPHKTCLEVSMKKTLFKYVKKASQNLD